MSIGCTKVPRFRGRSECRLHRATPQHHDLAANGSKGPVATGTPVGQEPVSLRSRKYASSPHLPSSAVRRMSGLYTLTLRLTELICRPGQLISWGAPENS